MQLSPNISSEALNASEVTRRQLLTIASASKVYAQGPDPVA